jgi:hypothetical protein
VKGSGAAAPLKTTLRWMGCATLVPSFEMVSEAHSYPMKVVNLPGW